MGLNEDHSVLIFARGGEKQAICDPNWNKPNVTWGKLYNDNWFRINWGQFKKWIQKNNIQVVIFNEQQDWEILVDCAKLNIITIAYIDYYTRETIPFFDLYDAVICHTKRHYSVFKNHFQAYYIPWGTDINLFKPTKNDKVRKSDVVFFHSAGMGGINFRKGTDIVVKAFSKFESGVKLIIHSQVPVDKFGNIGEIIEKNPRIEFIHRTVTAPGLYHLGDVYVYPSRLEGLGLTIMEALACGLPVITTDAPPMNEFIDDGKTGKLVDVKHYLGREDGYYWAESICSENSLFKAMEYFFQNKNEIFSLQQAARQSAVKKLNWKHNARYLCSVIPKLKENSDKLNVLKEQKHRILGYSFAKRKNGNKFFKRIVRKLYRRINKLD